MEQPKDFLGYENDRNKQNANLYTEILRAAWGAETAILVGHHICTEKNNDLNTENELPSADTLMFDHDIMTKVFGWATGLMIMGELSQVPCDKRDALLQHYWNMRTK